jgi:predicted secreted protein
VKQFSRKLLAVTSLTLAAGSLWAQAIPLPVVQNVVQLSASGATDVAQDWLTISLNTTRQGPDAAIVQAQLKTALDAALAQARPQVQAGQLELRTGIFSLYPRYGSDSKINGWQGSTELVLEGRDFPRISALAGKLATLTLGNVSFSLSREQRQKVEAEVQAQAIERFKAKAADIARGFGFVAYSLREVTVSAADQGISPVRPRVMALEARAATAESPVPVEAGKSSVTVTVSGSVQLK